MPADVTTLALVPAVPDEIFIGTRRRFASGATSVWRYKLTSVGDQRIYVCSEPPSTSHGNGDVMFIVPEPEGGSSMWRMRDVWSVVIWSSALLCFALKPPFGRLATMCGRPIALRAVQAMRTLGKSRSGRLRAGRFARSMGFNGFWARRAAAPGTILGTQLLLSGAGVRTKLCRSGLYRY